jgi:hypothetical protein
MRVDVVDAQQPSVDECCRQREQRLRCDWSTRRRRGRRLFWLECAMKELKLESQQLRERGRLERREQLQL